MLSADHPLQILTVRCPLAPSEADAAACLETSHGFAGACRFVVASTPESLRNETAIRAATYTQIRAAFGLSANVAQQAIARVIAMRRSAKTNNGGKVDNFRDGSVVFDERTFQLFGIESTTPIASLTLNGGRRRIPMELSRRHRAQIAHHVGAWNERKRSRQRIRSATLTPKFHNGRTRWMLHIQIEVACTEAYVPTDAIGVDLGRKDIAHTSTGRTWSGGTRGSVRARYTRIRRSLQKKAAKGTRSTRRRCRQILHRLSGREGRFHAAENHVIAKALVQDAKAMNAALHLEDLGGIRKRTSVKTAEMRHEHSGWSFFQLREFATYKAKIAGVPIEFLPPQYTSKTCSSCGCIGTRKGKVFTCDNALHGCGHRDDADRNAADNLRVWGCTVIHPRGPCCRLSKSGDAGLPETLPR